jgi:hypothetical protein
MCVVEKDVWSYPVGDGHELRGDDMPNLFEPVEAPPWGEWQVPWDRAQGDAEEYDPLAEPERLAFWLFSVGMMLWEIQQGWHSPLDITCSMPEPGWVDWALRWIEEAQPSKPPPRHHRHRRAAWLRRQNGVLCLLAGLLGLHHGLAVAASQVLQEEALSEAQGQVVWS